MTEVSPTSSPQTLASLLEQNARAHGDARALRYKARGLVRERSWRELANDASSVAGGTLEGATSTHRLGLDWLLRALHASSRAPRDAGQELQTSAARHEQRLWLDPALDDERTQRGLRYWLDTRVVLVVGETRDTAEIDRRELAPTLLFASADWYDTLASETVSRVSHGSRARRELLAWARRIGVAGEAPGLTSRGLAKWLVLGPLRDQLGLARVELAFSLGAPSARTHDFFSALAITLRPLDVRPVTVTSAPADVSSADTMFSAREGGLSV